MKNCKKRISENIPGMANGGANPHMLGMGMARDAGVALATRGNRIESALSDATSSRTPAIAAPAGKGGMSRIRDGAMPPAHMLAAQRRGMADGGMKRGNADKIEAGDGGSVRGPGGPTDDRVGPVALANTEYVLPGDTVEAMGGPEVLDEIRAKTHTFVDQKNKPAIMQGMADGGEKKKPWVSDFAKPAGTIPTMSDAVFGTRGKNSAPSPSKPVGQSVGAGARVAANGVSNAGVAIGQAARNLDDTRKGWLNIANNIPGAIAAPIASAVDSFGADVRTGFTGQKYAGREFVGKPMFGGGEAQAAQPAAVARPAIPSAPGLPSAEQVASDKARANAANAKLTPPMTPAIAKISAAESTLPAGVRGADGTLNSKALADSTFTADNDALLAEQDRRLQGALDKSYLQAGGNGNSLLGSRAGFNERHMPYEQNRVAEQFSPEMVEIVNRGIRARQNTPQSVAADNARFAMDGHGGVTKSVGKDGRVSYGDSAPNPFIASNFSNGKTGAQNMAARQANDAVNLKAGQERAAADKAELSRIELTRAALGGNNNAASILNNQGANEVNKLRIAADLAPKPASAYDQERTRGAKMENDRSAVVDGLLGEFMGAKDDKARESALTKLNAINGKNAGADKYIMGEVEAGVDALGNPIMRKTPFNTRTGQYVGMEGGAAPAAATNDGDIQEGDYLRGSDGKAYRRVNGQNVLVK